MKCINCNSKEAKLVHIPCVNENLFAMCVECMAAFLGITDEVKLEELREMYKALPERRVQ